MYRWEGKTGTIWQSRVCHENRHFGGRKLPDTSRESTKVWQILGVPNPSISAEEGVSTLLSEETARNPH